MEAAADTTVVTTIDLFHAVRDHLLKQNKKCAVIIPIFDDDEATILDYDTVCRYRGTNGLMCAAGVLIHDEYYSPTLEDHNVTTPEVRVAIERSIDRFLTLDELVMLEDLQKLHDMHEPYEWPHLLNRVEERISDEGVYR